MRRRRLTTAHYLKLDIAQLAAAGFDFDDARTGTITWPSGDNVRFDTRPGQGLKLQYKHGDKAITPYLLPVTWTEPNYGGRRPWWRCPRCGRRCRIVYGGPVFRCRQCHNLAYPLQQRSRGQAIEHTLQKRYEEICDQLEAPQDNSLLRRLPWGKPYNMWWSTFERLYCEAEAIRCMLILILAMGTGVSVNMSRLWELYQQGRYADVSVRCVAAYDNVRVQWARQHEAAEAAVRELENRRKKES